MSVIVPVMSRTERMLQVTALAIVVLHGIALAFPGELWGLSALAVWPRGFAVAWLLASIAACIAAPALARRARPLDFPGRRGAAVIAVAAGCLFWLLRERAHFSGDGLLLVRDQGMSETVVRARLLVEFTCRSVAAGRALGLDAAQSLAFLAIASGVAATDAILRISSHLGAELGQRWLVAALLLTSGAMQLFFGHIEYYPMAAAGLLLYLALVTRVLAPAPTRAGVFACLAAYGVLLTLHLALVALAPAVVWFAAWAWRRGQRLAAVCGMVAIPLVASSLTWLAGGAPGALGSTAVAGLHRYTQSYAASASAHHAFGLFSFSHWLAVTNDILRSAPLVLFAIPLLCVRRPGASERLPALRFLAIASAGCLLTNGLFDRELGPPRDWDILAPFAFVLLAWTGVLAASKGAASRTIVILALVTGLHHGLPWVLTHASPRAARAHVHLTLAATGQWSAHARGYMYEELAIDHRQRGEHDLATQAFAAAVQANPADARYRVGLGNQYAQRGQMQAAAQEYRLALEHRPDYAPAHNNLAFALASMQRDLDEARVHAERALQLEPENAEFLLTLARVEIASGRVPQARAALQRALRLRPVFPTAEKLLQSLAP